MKDLSRRDWLKGAAATGAIAASKTFNAAAFALDAKLDLPRARPPKAERHFTSAAVEALIPRLQKGIADPAVATIFENCYPNTLDTTVYPGTYEGKPDTYIVTGDIDAMWLRDSSAQVWPYLPLAKEDAQLRELLEGVIRRQARLILIDPYANAFMRDDKAAPLSWAVHDKTEHHAGVGERKWEVDSLCYTIRLAHGYWRATGDTKPFDARWKEAAWTIVRTFRTQQRKDGPGPYSFQRESLVPSDTLPLGGFGNPARPLGMIYSMFRPSDDACIFPLFVPANLFAVLSLRQLGELATHAADDAKLAAEAESLAAEVEQAVAQHGTVVHPQFGKIWAYEVDGFGSTVLMDDAGAPGLVSLPYLECCGLGDPIYQASRKFSLNEANPYFCRGKAGEGLGSPHEGLNMIWPMGTVYRALTTTDEKEIRDCLRNLRDTTAGTGFMHESFYKDDASKFTRPWFAWANTLFGELIVRLSADHSAVLKSPLS